MSEHNAADTSADTEMQQETQPVHGTGFEAARSIPSYSNFPHNSLGSQYFTPSSSVIGRNSLHAFGDHRRESFNNVNVSVTAISHANTSPYPEGPAPRDSSPCHSEVQIYDDSKDESTPHDPRTGNSSTDVVMETVDVPKSGHTEDASDVTEFRKSAPPSRTTSQPRISLLTSKLAASSSSQQSQFAPSHPDFDTAMHVPPSYDSAVSQTSMPCNETLPSSLKKHKTPPSSEVQPAQFPRYSEVPGKSDVDQPLHGSFVPSQSGVNPITTGHIPNHSFEKTSASFTRSMSTSRYVPFHNTPTAVSSSYTASPYKHNETVGSQGGSSYAGGVAIPENDRNSQNARLDTRNSRPGVPSFKPTSFQFPHEATPTTNISFASASATGLSDFERIQAEKVTAEGIRSSASTANLPESGLGHNNSSNNHLPKLGMGVSSSLPSFSHFPSSDRMNVASSMIDRSLVNMQTPPHTQFSNTSTQAAKGPDRSQNTGLGVPYSVPQNSAQEEHLDIANFPVADLLLMLSALLQKIIEANDTLHPQSYDHLPEEAHLDESNRYIANVLAFHGRNIPAISLHAYLTRILKYCPVTNEVFLSLLVYFDRIAKRANSGDFRDNKSEGDSGKEKDDSDTRSRDLSPPITETVEEDRRSSGSSSPKGKNQLFVMDSYNIHRLIIAGITVASKFFSDVFYKNLRYAKVGGLPLAELNHLEIQFLLLTDFRLMIPLEELQRYGDLLLKFWRREQSRRATNNSHTVNSPDPTHKAHS